LASNSAGIAISSNALLTVHVPPWLSAPVRLPDGTVLLHSSDVEGGFLTEGDLAGLTVLVSTNLVDWTALTSALTLTNGVLHVNDPAAIGAPIRFYRVVENW
jgi:hypothetical protein